jgi:hypothetical protein
MIKFKINNNFSAVFPNPSDKINLWGLSIGFTPVILLRVEAKDCRRMVV